MKSLLKNILVAAAVAGALGFTSLHALPTVTVTDVYSDNPNGGVFIAATSNHGTFETFCLELTENLNLAPYVHYYTLSNQAIGGGSGGGSPDAISLATAWLYRNYASLMPTATQPEYRAVQEAFWFLENEGAYAANAYVTAAQTAIGANWNNDANGAFGVQVMNMWYDANGTVRAQDLLIAVPDQGFTLALVGATFGLLALVSRRKRT